MSDGDGDEEELPDITTIVRDRYEHVEAPRATFELLDSLPNRAQLVSSQVGASFSDRGAAHIARENTWAIRYHGAGIGRDVVDLGQLAVISGDLDRSVLWTSASLYPGHRHTAGAEAALAGNSIVLLLVPGVNEEPIESNGELIFPSVEAGRYLATLMAAAGEPTRLSDLLGPLSANARGAYVKQIDNLAKAGLGLQSIVRLPARTSEQSDALRQVNLNPTQVLEERAVLTAPARYKRTKDVVDGVFVGWDRDRRKFKLSRDDEQGDYIGDFPEDLTRVVGRLQDKRVEITVTVEEPQFSWMPRRDRAHKMLKSVEVLTTRRSFPRNRKKA